MSDLFESAAEEVMRRQAPLAARLRPRQLDDLVGHDELLGTQAPLRTLIQADKLTSIILWGPPTDHKSMKKEEGRFSKGATAIHKYAKS